MIPRIWCKFGGVSPRNPYLFNMAQLFAAISTPPRTVRRYLPHPTDQLPLYTPTILSFNMADLRVIVFGLCRFCQHFSSKSLSFNMVDLRVIQTGIYYYCYFRALRIQCRLHQAAIYCGTCRILERQRYLQNSPRTDNDAIVFDHRCNAFF